ncbi:MAG: hypothetical protein ACK4V1_07970, partial [Burkholderiaceae bacterium]
APIMTDVEVCAVNPPAVVVDAPTPARTRHAMSLALVVAVAAIAIAFGAAAYKTWRAGAADATTAHTPGPTADTSATSPQTTCEAAFPLTGLAEQRAARIRPARTGRTI